MQNHEKETNLLLMLIRAALHPEAEGEVPFDPECDLHALERMIFRQSLLRMVGPTLKKQQDPAWQKLWQHMQPLYDQELYCGLVQEYEMQALLDEMEQEGIDCLPMKGWVMRQYYPEPLMRSMSDLDVLIRGMDGPRMKAWMEARDYALSEVEEGFHDAYKKPPYLFVELHYKLIDQRHLTHAERVWLDQQSSKFWEEKMREKGKQHIYRLSDEAFYTHHLSHFYKHFTNAGVGLRPLVDLYLLRQALGEKLDDVLLYQHLRQLHLDGFATRMEQLSERCFGCPEALEESDWVVLEFLTGAGIYGSSAEQKTLRIMHRKGGAYLESVLKSTVKHFLLPLHIMRTIYPVLERYPVLLPLCWLHRGFRVLFVERERFQLVADAQSREKYDNMKKIFHAAGID